VALQHNTPMNFLQVSGISKALGGQVILQDIHFTQRKGQQIAIAGESGSGKSTLLKIIAGLIQPDAGEVLFEGSPVEGPNEKLIPGHPHIAYLSQHFELRNNYRVEEVLEYANTLPPEESKRLYEICHISHLLQRKTDQVSGGEKQRIALAKLLTTSPRLLLLDEPFSNLDMRHRNVLKSVISRISEQLDITCLLVSHDQQDILPWADEIIIMRAGKILQQGTPATIYRQPLNTYVAGLLGKFSVIPTGLLNGMQQQGKYLFVRPEQLQLVPATPGTLRGTVHKIWYTGSDWEIEVLMEHDTVTVRSQHGNFQKGDTVFVAVSKDEIWFWK
jgi:ABC-type Fe3+/spermidine/putrescine transport system ATPase subunit